MKKNYLNSGQVVILLLLIMVVALAIGLSTIGRSVLEVSTSRQSEDSSRAFSAAEAAIEKAIKQNENSIGNPSSTSISVGGFSNLAEAQAQAGAIPVSTNALSFSPYDKRAFSQFWLVSPDNTGTPGYNQASFDLYFGDPDTTKYTAPDGKSENQPAIEANVIYWDGTKYQSLKNYYDSKQDGGINNPRIGTTCDARPPLSTVITDDGTTESYYCRVSVTGYPHTASAFPVMVRIRLLYTEIAHPVALKPVNGDHLPSQANLYKASGNSGNVKRTLEVKNYRSVMPQLFDYVLFSASNLQKE